MHDGRNLKRSGGQDEFENEICSRRTHGFSDVGAYLSGPKRKCAAGRTTGAVSGHGRYLGDLRAAVCQVEIEGSCVDLEENEDHYQLHPHLQRTESRRLGFCSRFLHIAQSLIHITFTTAEFRADDYEAIA